MQTNLQSLVDQKKDVLKLNQLRLAAIMYWAISSVVKNPKTAFMCANTQSMAAKFAKTSGFDVVNVLPKRLLQHYGYWIYERALALGYGSVICADVSRDVILLSKVNAGFFDMGKAPLSIKQRTIDEQYGGLQKLDWLHIEDHTPHLLLSGALALIERDKPIVTLTNIMTKDALDDVLAIMTAHGYLCFDSALEAIDASAITLNGIPSICFCIHQKDSALDTIRNIMGFNASGLLNNRLGSQDETVSSYYNSLLNYKTPAQNLLKGYLFNDYQLVDIDTQLMEGFYAREHYDDAYYNWSGPSSESKIVLALEATGQYYFRAPIYSLPEQIQSLPLHIFVDGVLCAASDIKQDSEIIFEFSVTEKPICGVVEILFCIPHTVNIDGRSIGFSFSHIELYFKESELQ